MSERSRRDGKWRAISEGVAKSFKSVQRRRKGGGKWDKNEVRKTRRGKREPPYQVAGMSLEVVALKRSLSQ